MSWFRKKSELEIPPVEKAPAYSSSKADDDARSELFSSSKRGPPSYRSNASVYNASRDGDPYNPPAPSERPAPSREGSGSSGRVPDRYSNMRSTIGDPYARGGNADADREKLFAGYDAKKNARGNRFDDRAGPSAYDGADDGPRTFQTQDEEEEEVEGIKQNMRFVKQDSVNSTRNALRIAREAEETARNTLLRLGDQSEKLANTERHLDLGKANAVRAADRTDELKKLNRSIFRPAITFNKDAKRAAQEAKIAERHEEERSERERAMQEVRDSHNRIGRAATYGRGDGDDDEEGIGGGSGRYRSEEQQAIRKDQRKRYQFEATESDDELENELDDNLDEIADVSKRLRALAVAAGDEIDDSNRRIENMGKKVTSLNTRVDTNTSRLRKIK